MMQLITESGKDRFYQWDTGQRLQVTEAGTCREVHFCRGDEETALVCLIREEEGLQVVSVPNLLLQQAGTIYAYAFGKNREGMETKWGNSFEVQPRPRPEDYVYTETEALYFADLEERIRTLETEEVSPEAVARGVNAYMEANPVTPEGIGALPAESLPEAVEDALTMAKERGEFTGEKGDTGKTAYQYAKEGGYTGTEGEFAEKLAREYPTKLSQLANDAGFITGYTETDPTVPAWAKAAKKPVYTAGEVGALPDTTVIPGKLSDLTADASHRTVTDAEKSTWNAKANISDIPTKVSELTNDKGFLTGYTETDPTVPAWAKAASKPSYTPSEVGALPNTTKIPAKTSDLTNDSGFITGYTETDPTVPGWAKASSKPSYSKSEVGLGNVENVKQYSANNPPPYPVTSVNGKTGAVVLDAAAVGARPSSWTPTAANVGAVPTSRKVNGKALSADITLSAADVKAVPQTETMKLEGVDADGVSHVFKIYGVAGWSGVNDPE